METLEALPLDYLVEKVNKLREIAKSQNRKSYFGEESQADITHRTERELMGLDCDICKNLGVVVTDDGGHGIAKECGCMVIYRNKMRIKKSGLSNAFTNNTFDKYTVTTDWQKTVKNMAVQFISEMGKWFYIGGGVGSGKSHICTAICGELIKTMSVYYMPWRDDIVLIKANVTNDEEYTKLVHRLKTVDVLYVDDFFKGNVTAADKNIAFEIVNYRYNNRLTTIISTEFNIDNVFEIDAATGSRIYQMSKGYCIDIPKNAGMNYRLK